MAYPTTPAPLYGYSPEAQENVHRTPSEIGVIQSRDAWGRTRFAILLSYLIGHADFRTLMAYCTTNRRAQFNFFDFNGEVFHTNITVGTGNGATTVFTLPARSTSGLLVYKDGVLQTLTTHYTISVGTGAESEDRITFVTAPANGLAITASFQGKRRYLCEFSGPVRYAWTTWNRVTVDVPIIEVLT